MKSFAFIVCPKTIEQIKHFWPALRIVPDFILKALSNRLPALKVSHIKKIQSIQERNKEADIVITTDGLPDFTIGELKPNAIAILCDISLSGDVHAQAKSRPDITVIKAGLIKLPFSDKLGINTGLPPDIIWAPLAETMLLTFEEKFVSYSLGENTNLDKLEEIADIAARHGFEVWVPEAPVL